MTKFTIALNAIAQTLGTLTARIRRDGHTSDIQRARAYLDAYDGATRAQEERALLDAVRDLLDRIPLLTGDAQARADRAAAIAQALGDLRTHPRVAPALAALQPVDPAPAPAEQVIPLDDLIAQLGSLTIAEPTPPAEPAAIVLLTEADARQLADRIRTGLDDLRSLIDTFDTAEGWRALGYDSFRAWALAEVDGTSLRSVYRLRDAAAVDRSLGVTIGHTPESHARVLKNVPAEERPAVMERAATIAGERPVQARDLAAAAGVTNGHTPPAFVPPALADAPPLTPEELAQLAARGYTVPATGMASALGAEFVALYHAAEATLRHRTPIGWRTELRTPPTPSPAAFAELQARARAIGADLAWEDGEYRVIRPGMLDVHTADVARLRGWLALEEQKHAPNWGHASPPSPPPAVAPAEERDDPVHAIIALSERLADALAAEHWAVVAQAANHIELIASTQERARGGNLPLNPRWLVQELETLEREIAAGLCDAVTEARLDSLTALHSRLSDVLDDATFAAIDDRLDAAAEAFADGVGGGDQ